MTEKPLDRLNYFNGQRLEASDLKAEQEYHIRVRRWLNKSLYSSGIARGLEVRAEKVVAVDGKKPPPTVVVSPGLALDDQGREIILWEEQRIQISSEARRRSGNTEGEVEGLYLTIRYSEEVTAVERDGCEAVGETTRGDRLAWGGPTRVRERALFEQRDFLPPESSGEVVLAWVELNGDCSEVHQPDVGVRRYVGAASAAKVRQYALEGEREVAAIPTDDPLKPLLVKARVYFHIRRRQPNAVTLYLKAEEFSALHYTELGAHNHGLNVKGGTGPADPPLSPKTKHNHAVRDDKYALTVMSVNKDTGETSAHGHDLTARRAYSGNRDLIGTPHDTGRARTAGFFLHEDGHPLPILVATLPPVSILNIPVPNVLEPILRVDPNAAADVDGSISGGAHGHPIEGSTAEHPGFDLAHKHSLSGTGTSDDTGAADSTQPDKIARAGPPLGYVYDLHVAVDNKDQTSAIRDQIKVSRPSAESASWDLLGNGSAGHPLADKDKGTGPIKLDFLPGVTFDVGEHVIEFSVPLGPNEVANGGKILFNLYIE